MESSHCWDSQYKFLLVKKKKNKKNKSVNIILTEVNEHLAKALPHVLWHRQDTGYVVVKEGILLLEVI